MTDAGGDVVLTLMLDTKALLLTAKRGCAQHYGSGKCAR